MIKPFLKEFEEKKAVIIGNTPLVGRPTGDILKKLKFNLDICEKDTPNLNFITRDADIIITDIASPKYIGGDWIKPGAVVIDAGMNVIGGKKKKKIVGDINFAEAVKNASHITPVPGGVGPLTIAMLIDNVLLGWHRTVNTC